MAEPDFISALGRPFAAHRFRRLSELFVDGYAKWLPRFGVNSPPRALSTLLLLDRGGPLGVTELAARLRLSHPLLIRLVGALAEQGTVRIGSDPHDSRRRPVALTAMGRAEVTRVKAAMGVLDRAFADLFEEIDADLLAIVEHTEAACRTEAFSDRIERVAEAQLQEKSASCV